MVCVHSQPNTEKLLLRLWDLDPIDSSAILPPKTDEELDPKTQIFPKLIPKDYSLVTCGDSSIPTAANRSKHPMPENLYTHYYDNLLSPLTYKVAKQAWLWQSFVRNYHDKLNDLLPPIDFKKPLTLNTISSQMIEVENYKTRMWQYWMIWQNQMLNFPTTVAPEIIMNPSCVSASVAVG
jgi:hypothetical protein